MAKSADNGRIEDLHLKRNEPEDIDQAQTFSVKLCQNSERWTSTIIQISSSKNCGRSNKFPGAQAIAHRKVTREKAGRIQHTFMPTQSPVIPGIKFQGPCCRPETSGDFYDFIDLSNGRLGIVIADVGDKGAGAALYMAMSRTLIRTYAGEGERTPGEIISEVNRRILTDTQRGIFLTAFTASLTLRNTLTYVNAGHNPPVLIQEKDGDLTFLLKKTRIPGRLV